MLDFLIPGPLKMGFYKYAKTNNFPPETLQSSTDVAHLRINIAQLYDSPPKSEKNPTTGKGIIGKSTQRGTIGLEFSALRNSISHEKYSNAGQNLEPILDIPCLASAKFGRRILCRNPPKHGETQENEARNANATITDPRRQSKNFNIPNAPRFMGGAPSLSPESL